MRPRVAPVPRGGIGISPAPAPQGGFAGPGIDPAPQTDFGTPKAGPQDRQPRGREGNHENAKTSASFRRSVGHIVYHQHRHVHEHLKDGQHPGKLRSPPSAYHHAERHVLAESSFQVKP